MLTHLNSENFKENGKTIVKSGVALVAGASSNFSVLQSIYVILTCTYGVPPKLASDIAKILTGLGVVFITPSQTMMVYKHFPFWQKHSGKENKENKNNYCKTISEVVETIIGLLAAGMEAGLVLRGSGGLYGIPFALFSFVGFYGIFKEHSVTQALLENKKKIKTHVSTATVSENQPSDIVNNAANNTVDEHSKLLGGIESISINSGSDSMSSMNSLINENEKEDYKIKFWMYIIYGLSGLIAAGSHGFEAFFSGAEALHLDHEHKCAAQIDFAENLLNSIGLILVGMLALAVAMKAGTVEAIHVQKAQRKHDGFMQWFKDTFDSIFLGLGNVISSMYFTVPGLAAISILPMDKTSKMVVTPILLALDTMLGTFVHGKYWGECITWMKDYVQEKTPILIKELATRCSKNADASQGEDYSDNADVRGHARNNSGIWRP